MVGALLTVGLLFALDARDITHEMDEQAETYEVGFAAGRTQGLVEGRREAEAAYRAKRRDAGLKASRTRKARGGTDGV
jgi:hypothetical protein